MRPVAMLVAVGAAAVMSAANVWAQSAYVAGTVAAEVVRTSSTKSGGTTYDSGSGEALAGAIRVGTLLTPRFGVELEYFRPGEIEGDSTGPIYLTGAPGVLYSNVSAAAASLPGADLVYPIVSQTSGVRSSTTSTLLTARQPLGARAELVYLGGVGFSRVVRETEYGFPRGLLPLAAPIQRSSTTRTTQYCAGPVVGVEIRAGMTEHAQVVAGLRLHTLGQALVDGWMIRPSVGLAWKF